MSFMGQKLVPCGVNKNCNEWMYALIRWGLLRSTRWTDLSAQSNAIDMFTAAIENRVYQWAHKALSGSKAIYSMKKLFVFIYLYIFYLYENSVKNVDIKCELFLKKILQIFWISDDDNFQHSTAYIHLEFANDSRHRWVLNTSPWC